MSVITIGSVIRVECVCAASGMVMRGDLTAGQCIEVLMGHNDDTDRCLSGHKHTRQLK